MVRLFPRLCRRARRSNSDCGTSEFGSECSSLRQEYPDTNQIRLSAAGTVGDWSFPSYRSGLRVGKSNGSRLLFSSSNTLHGAAFPASEMRSPGRSHSGGWSYSQKDRLLQQPRRSRVPNAVACCSCSDSSTHSGASAELCRLRWGGSAQLLAYQQQQSPCVEPHQAVGLILNVPTLIQTRGLKCLILDAPTNENLPAYLAEMHSVGVTDLVRACSPTYDDSEVVASGIRVHELIFPDGEAPPAEVIAKWRALVARVSADGGTLAVHCVAGLGRAPVLVALSLIDRGLDPEEAVRFIRDRRKGAINRRQLAFLHNYRRHAAATRRCMKGCTIM